LVSPLLEATLYHGYPARKHKHQNVVAIEKYILNTPVAGMLLNAKGKPCHRDTNLGHTCILWASNG
jgi:hypothetical protein